MDTTPRATEENVAAACEEFAAQGIRPTQDLVRSRTGGSSTTITKLMDRWFRGYVLRTAGKLADAPPEPKSAEEAEIEVMLKHIMKRAQSAASNTAKQEFHLEKQHFQSQLDLAHEVRRQAEDERDAALEQSRKLERALTEKDAQRLGLDEQLRQAQESIVRLEGALREREAVYEVERKRWMAQLDQGKSDTKSALETLTAGFNTLKTELDAIRGQVKPVSE